MKLDEFFSRVKESSLKLNVSNLKAENQVMLENEALFHLPLLASMILIMSKGVNKPKASLIGSYVSTCLERVMVAFKGSSQEVAWSANLRIRTVKALSFLEYSKLVEIDQNKHTIKTTKLGSKVANKALEDSSDLSVTLQMIQKEYLNIIKENRISNS